MYTHGKGGAQDKQTKVILLGDAAEDGKLRDLLSKHFIITCVRNLPEALKLLQGGGYDVLFCDWSFDGATWREALSEVRKRYPGLPTIIVYHGAEENDWVDVLKAGAVDLLAPPYDERLLLRILDYAVSHEATTVGTAA